MQSYILASIQTSFKMTICQLCKTKERLRNNQTGDLLLYLNLIPMCDCYKLIFVSRSIFDLKTTMKWVPRVKQLAWIMGTVYPLWSHIAARHHFVIVMTKSFHGMHRNPCFQEWHWLWFWYCSTPQDVCMCLWNDIIYKQIKKYFISIKGLWHM